MVSSGAIVLLTICLLPGVVHGWWPFSSSEEESTSDIAPAKKPATFEMATAEQKFLNEAQQLLDLAPLDKCLHGVVAQLRFSCGEVSEEELGKLSVQLLNCQSAAEGRPTYACTHAMNLGECTRPMDAHTWNTYHIISNRARSVCYATRQQQFRRQTEMAVNKLSSATIQQLQAMEDLASSQHQIKQATDGSLKSLREHQNHLLESQREILASQEGAREKLAHNLEQLTREKQLINSGQEQLSNMTLSIHQQLEEAASLLGDQEESMRKGHQQIKEDISKVKENIQQVWERVDSSTSQLLNVIDEMGSQYKATLENLHLINSTVTSMMTVVMDMHSMLSTQLDWLVEQLGGAQDGLKVLTTLATHAAFLFVAILCVLFVKAPGFTRLSLLVLVSINAAVEIRYKVSLTFAALSTLQIFIMIGNWFYLWHKSSSRHQPPLYQPQPVALKPHLHYQDDVEPSEAPETITHTPKKMKAEASPCPRSKLLTVQCEAKTRTGLKCKLPALDGSFCRRHARYC